MSVPSFWDRNPDAAGRLSLLWGEGLSTAEIGRRLGCSKNAVVSKARRDDLPSRQSPIIRGGVSRARRPRPSRAKAVTLAVLPSAAVILNPEPRPIISVPATKRAPPAPEQTIFASHQFPPQRKCLFPIGQPGAKGFRFCGEYVVTPGPYCDACRLVAYAPHRVREAA